MSDPVLKLLQDNNLSFTISGKDYVIKCLNPQHEDSNPSCRVDKLSGLTHCFSCGWKRNLFKHFGVFTNTTVLKVATLKEKLHQLKVGNLDLELPKGASPYTQVFRGISAATFKKFGAFYTHEEESLVDRIIFPIKDIQDKNIAFVGRHMLSDAVPRYKNWPSGAVLSCYPVKFDAKYTSIILVEGIFDMLNLYDKGIHNVVATFGTNTMKNHTSRKMLPYKVQGITKVYILFDGDEPGVAAANELKPLLEQLDFSVEIISLPEDLDPGAMNQEYVNSIKEYIDGHNTTSND